MQQQPCAAIVCDFHILCSWQASKRQQAKSQKSDGQQQHKLTKRNKQKFAKNIKQKLTKSATSTKSYLAIFFRERTMAPGRCRRVRGNVATPQRVALRQRSQRGWLRDNRLRDNRLRYHRLRDNRRGSRLRDNCRCLHNTYANVRSQLHAVGENLLTSCTGRHLRIRSEQQKYRTVTPGVHF